MSEQTGTTSRRGRAIRPCPNQQQHTDGPEGYLQWHAWAATMARTHRQRRCGGCGLWAIWEQR